MKYSVTCPDFLITVLIKSTFSGAEEGIKKLRIGLMTREVFSEENVPVDIQKMKIIQKITGTQDLYFLIICITFNLLLSKSYQVVKPMSRGLRGSVDNYGKVVRKVMDFRLEKRL